MARRTPAKKALVPVDAGDPWKSDAINRAIKGRSTRDGSSLDERWDDYVNQLTGIGDYLQDRMYGGNQHGADFLVRYLSATDCENRWRGSDLGARIIETIPDEMTREGWELSIQPTEDDEDDKDHADALPPEELAEPTKRLPGALPEIEDEGTDIVEAIDGSCDELNVVGAINEALRFERAYGGAAILIGAQDGIEDLAEPLDENNITSVDWLHVFQGGPQGEIIAWSYYADPRAKKYGQPEVYLIRNLSIPVNHMVLPGGGLGRGRQVAAELSWVHESRLLIFPGTAPSRDARIQMRGWGDSLFTRIDEILSQYGQTWGGVAVLMSQFNQDVLKTPGLVAKLSGNNQASRANPITARARLIQRTKSLSRMLVIDKEEEFQRAAASVAGVSEILQQFALRLAAAADMPVALLMGQSPAGLNATGASDIRFFYDRIAARQRRVLLPLLKRVLRLLMLSKNGPTSGIEPHRWTVKFRSLYQLTELEQATLRKTVADTDAVYLSQGVLSPEEVTVSRYGGSAWSMETTIDLEGRRMMSEQETAKQLAATVTQNAGAVPSVPDGQKITLTPSAQGSIITVNEARAKTGLMPLVTEGGLPDPDGELTIAAFTTKNAAEINAAAKISSGEMERHGPEADRLPKE